ELQSRLFQRAQSRLCVGPYVERAVNVQQIGADSGCELNPQRTRRELETVSSHLGEVGVSFSSDPQPLVLKLTRAPNVDEPRAAPRKFELGDRKHSTGVEDNETVERDRTQVRQRPREDSSCAKHRCARSEELTAIG